MELILCRVVESIGLPNYNIVPHISWHDPPCHRTHEGMHRFSEHGSFSVLTAEIRDSNMVL